MKSAVREEGSLDGIIDHASMIKGCLQTKGHQLSFELETDGLREMLSLLS